MEGGTRAVQPTAGAVTLAAHGREEAPHDGLSRRGQGDRMVAAVKPDSTTSTNEKPSDELILDQLRSHVTRITSQRAQEILTTQNYSRQRDLRPSHVAYLVEAIRRGELNTLSLVFAEGIGGRRVLVDGQHRLTALVQTGYSLPATITTHRVLDDHDLARLYAKIDRQSTRTPQAILRAYGIEERSPLSSTILQRLAQGVSIVDSDFARDYRARSKSLIQRAEATERWLPYGEQYAAMMSGASDEVGRLLWRAAVVAVGLATIRYQAEMAEEFWAGAAQEDGLARNDARARLLAWLRAHRVAAVRGDINYSRHVAGAWNAYFEGRTLERLQIKDQAATVRILGTPYGRGTSR